MRRRTLLLGAAAVGGGVLAARPAQAEAPPAHAAARPAQGKARTDCSKIRSVGCFEVLALTDAAGPFFLSYDDAFSGASGNDWAAARRIDPAAFGPDRTWHLSFRCYAIRRPGDRYTLVDTGVGPEGSPASAWAPVPGALPQLLAGNGIDVRRVDTVVLTHLHEDHAGWAVTAEGVPMFPNARYVVQQRELDALEAGGSEMLGYVVRPLRAAGQLHPVDGAVVLSGDLAKAGRRTLAGRRGDRIRVVPTPGHTPGHQSVLVEGGRHDQVVVTGDVLVHAVQVVDPDVAYRYEADQDEARLTRRSLLDAARRERAVLATAHLNRPFVELD
ncbi:MBL fold metallo-hydrolase [Verrucosispora sp. WMMD1129]|uniref:MBL fold metallo-hydrolase n=1 Tax=Verrucosispora sp. WMMD1129 TaxID=3016093 RepID=UPI00249B4B29|nr:MBL fold metallo-hydrolase [Verrucosispora sp. WMMD1129]WFE44769.1 MBL fold metallo-hydrolase [Verrucosispora sp. WMMD1129]